MSTNELTVPTEETTYPPVMGDPRVNTVRWMRKNLFRTPLDAMLTVGIISAVAWLLWHLIPWAFIDATWVGSSRSACNADGACWAFIGNRYEQFLYGFYPSTEYWRPGLTMIMLAVGLVALMVPRIPGKRVTAVLLTTVYPVVGFMLLKGGVLGLENVPTNQWGGFLLTLVLAVSGFIVSFPLGVLLALGRRSSLPFISLLSIGFIEIVRGLPFVTILFMALVMLPYFLPASVQLNALGLAVCAIILYESAYLAEVIRGGLQAVPVGQYEASRAIGFGYWRIMVYIVLPQAVTKIIPALVNNTIALIKNTTLVMIVGLFELLNIVSAGAADPIWIGSDAEGYVVVGLVFWTISFGLSTYSRRIEKALKKSR